MTTTEFKVDFVCDAFPSIPKAVIQTYVEKNASKSIEQLCEHFLSYEEKNIENNEIPTQNNEVVSQICQEPQHIVQDKKALAEMEEADRKLAQKLYEEELMAASQHNTDDDVIFIPSQTGKTPQASSSSNNNLLAQLNRERQNRIRGTTPSTVSSKPSNHSTSTASSAQRVDRSFLASVHERRLNQEVPKGTTSASTTSPAAPQNTIRQSKGPWQPSSQPSMSEQLRLARQKHKQKWKNNTPTARMMTLSDLSAKDKLIEQTKAGGLESSDTTQKGGIHTIESAFANPDKIGKEALEFTNKFRAQHGLPPLKWSPPLAKIGEKHSRDMGDGRCDFSHKGFNERVAAYPFRSISAAENLALNSGSADVAKVAVDGWINSPGHRKNLLANHNYCGIGVYRNASGVWYLTQLFALVP